MLHHHAGDHGVQVCPGQEKGEEAQASQILTEENPNKGAVLWHSRDRLIVTKPWDFISFQINEPMMINFASNI